MISSRMLHLSMNPLKQGLKQCMELDLAQGIEHLSMNPLKQGLKQKLQDKLNAYKASIYP